MLPAGLVLLIAGGAILWLIRRNDDDDMGPPTGPILKRPIGFCLPQTVEA